jgi:hypothetical protein
MNTTPAIGPDNTIYIASINGLLNAIEPDNHLRWSFMTSYTIGSSTAIAADGSVYFMNGQNILNAFDVNGGLKWSYNTSGKINSTPVISADGIVFVGDSTYIYAVNPDGTLLWKGINPTGDSPMIIGADRTIYSVAEGSVYAIGAAEG